MQVSAFVLLMVLQVLLVVKTKTLLAHRFVNVSAIVKPYISRRTGKEVSTLYTVAISLLRTACGHCENFPTKTAMEYLPARVTRII